jgi:hypothetical protein
MLYVIGSFRFPDKALLLAAAEWCCICELNDFFYWLYSPLRPWPLMFQFHDHFTDSRTPWTSDQLVARPLPKHRTTQTQNKHIHIPNIHALIGIRTHDPGFRASEDSACLRPFNYRDRQLNKIRT